MLSQIKETKYINSILQGKILPFLIPLILSVAIWLNPNFLAPDTYYNIGDTVFPLSPAHYFQKISSSWVHDEIGFANLIPTILPSYFILSLLDSLLIPLWVINRLWLVIPTAMVGWSTYYLYSSMLKGRYAAVSGIITSIFSMLPPQISAIPLWYISLSGFSLTLGALIKGLNSSTMSWRYPALISVGSVLLLGNPRCFYLTIIAVFFYISIYFYLDRTLLKNKIVFLSITVITMLIANAFWLIPTFYYYISGNPSLEANLSSEAKGGGAQWDILRAYINWSNPLWISRLMTSGPLSTRDYIMQSFIYPFTFIMPLYAFTSLFFFKNNKSFISFKVITLLFLVFAFSLHFPATAGIYFYLFEHFPGFIILNSPNYWLFVLGVMYAVLTGATTQAILSKVDESEISLRLKNVFIFLLICSQIALITIVYGGGVLIGGPKGSLGSGNHIPAVKIPKEYFALSEYLIKNSSDGNRILNLPWSNDPYRMYTWFSIKPMPEIVHSISTIPVSGFWNSPIAVKSAIILLKENHANAIRSLNGLGVKFLVLHKDYKSVDGFFNPEDYTSYEGILNNSQYLEKIMDNLYFNLYLLKDKSAPSVYLLQQDIKKENRKQSNLQNNIELFKFTGENYINLGSPMLLNFTEKFTIAHWIYMDKNAITPQGIFTKNAGSGDITDNYFTMVQNNKVWFPINLGKQTIAYHGGAVDKNNWYHAAVVFNKEKSEYILYINGIPIAVNQTQGAIIPSASPVLIGAYGGNNPMHFFKGFIANVQIYSEPLTYDEIQSLYLSGIEGKAILNRGLRGWWKLSRENIEETNARDLSGNNLHGIINGRSIYDSITGPAIYAGNINNEVATISYRKISDTEYKINPIDNDSFYLVLNQAFHPLWKAFVGEREVDEHSPSEIGMNKWHIKDAKDREITIIFTPQKWFNIGLLISCSFGIAIIPITVFLKYFKNADR